MSVPYTDSEASEARQWSNRYGPPNAWTASLGTAARMIGRLLDERERLMAKQTVAAPGDDYIREWREEFQRWKAVAEEKQDLRDHFAAAALTGLVDTHAVYHREPPALATMAYAMADAMLRERCRGGGDCPPPDNAPNHDAAPAARASVDSVAPQPTTDGRERTDKSPARTVDGTGESDRPKPIKSTPVSHATHREGSVRRECTEPAAWGVAGSKGLLYATSISRMDAVDMQSEHECDTHVVPLYRSPALTEAEREAVEKMRVHLYEISRDNAFIDDVCDDAKASYLAISEFLERHG